MGMIFIHLERTFVNKLTKIWVYQKIGFIEIENLPMLNVQCGVGMAQSLVNFSLVQVG